MEGYSKCIIHYIELCLHHMFLLNIFRMWEFTAYILINATDTRSSTFSWNKVISTARKMKFSVKDFFSKRDQIRTFLQVWPHLLKKSLTENFIVCEVWTLDENVILTEETNLPSFFSPSVFLLNCSNSAYFFGLSVTLYLASNASITSLTVVELVTCRGLRVPLGK